MPRTNDTELKPKHQPKRNQQEPLDHKTRVEDEELETEDEELAKYDLVEHDVVELNMDDLRDMEGEGPDA